MMRFDFHVEVNFKISSFAFRDSFICDC